MMGFGFLLMLLVLALPVAAIVALVIWLNRGSLPGNLFGVNPPSRNREQATGPVTSRFCSHCGAGLQEGWTHCPQCGAPAGS
ncbi:MAG: zinc-ribbon domain-containing protein [Chloroflexota bacterium]